MSQLALLIGIVAASSQAAPQEDTWRRYGFGESGISYLLPAAPEMLRENLTTWKFESKLKNLAVIVRTQRVGDDQTHNPAKMYEAVYRPYHEKYGNKIKQVENFSEVVGADAYGIPSSMGFVMDIQDGSRRLVVGWQTFADLGWQYELIATAPADQANDLFRVFDSFQFVDPTTKRPKVGEIGQTGLQSEFGQGFLPKEIAPNAEEQALYSEAYQFDLRSDRLPVVASAQMVRFRDVAKVNVEEYVGRFQSVVSQVMRGGKLDHKLEPTTVDGKPGHRLTGNISDSRLTIEVEGRIVVQQDRLWSVLVFYAAPGEDSKAMGAGILGSLRFKPES